MKPGDMVTWKQRPDLRGEGFPPTNRLLTQTLSYFFLSSQTYTKPETSISKFT